ncbi:hypothetical protein [Bacillus tropicus]|nr:hypothetical protein [Bacillus tropicus]
MEEKTLIELLEQGESAELECKAAKGGLPKDVWETIRHLRIQMVVSFY